MISIACSILKNSRDSPAAEAIEDLDPIAITIFPVGSRIEQLMANTKGRFDILISDYA